MNKLYGLLFSLCMFFSSVTIAEEVVIFADYKAKPKNWVSDDGTAHGIQYEILKEITKRSGIQFSFHFTPWKRAVRMSQLGHGGIIGFSKSKERMKEWSYSEPIYFDELIVISMKKRSLSFIDERSLNGLRVGIKLGARYGDKFEQAVSKNVFQIVESTNRVDQLQLLTTGQVDAVLMSPGKFALDIVILENAWLQKYKTEFVVHTPAFRVDPNHIALPKSLNKSHILAPINTAIQAIMSDGSYQAIVQRVTEEALNAHP